MKTKILSLLSLCLLAAACGVPETYSDPVPGEPINLGTPCDTVQEDGNYVIFCGGVQMNVTDPGHTVKCYYKVEEDGSRTVRCNTPSFTLNLSSSLTNC